jgi:hypothetical protein
MPSSIPVVTIAYNNLTFIRSFVQQLQRITEKVIILDNASTYPALLAYYEEIQRELGDKIEIRRMSENYGHTVWQREANKLPAVFGLSDPDLELNPDMPDDCLEHFLALSIKYNHFKVGAALNLFEPEKFIKNNNYAGNRSIYDWELQFWKSRIPNDTYELYSAEIDTTFCLINTNLPRRGADIRVGGVFTCKHLPWYENYIRDNVPAEELAYWRQGNRSSTILRVL